jgi:regulator of nonsense transcripts 2
MFNTFEEAAIAVDEMFNVAFQNAGCEFNMFHPNKNQSEPYSSVRTGDDSGDDDDEEEGTRREADADEDGEGSSDSPVSSTSSQKDTNILTHAVYRQTDERAPSPEAVILKSSSQELLGPSEDDDAEFAKELAKMVTDTADARKVDKRTALALWDQTVPPPVVRKKRGDDLEESVDSTQGPMDDQAGVMKFTLFTKRGNKPQVSDTNLVFSISFDSLCFLDATVGDTRRVYFGCPDSYCPDARQG